MIVEMKKEDENRIFVEAYEVDEFDDKVTIYPQDPEDPQSRMEYKKDNYKYIKIKNHGGQNSFLKKRDTNER